MITAIVFVKADVARIPEVAEQIAALDGVSEVYSVTGQIDLIALVRVRDHDDVAAVVADRLNKVPGVTATETHIAFRTYSQHDLESAFSPRPGLSATSPSHGVADRSHRRSPTRQLLILHRLDRWCAAVPRHRLVPPCLFARMLSLTEIWGLAFVPTLEGRSGSQKQG